MWLCGAMHAAGGPGVEVDAWQKGRVADAVAPGKVVA